MTEEVNLNLREYIGVEVWGQDPLPLKEAPAKEQIREKRYDSIEINSLGLAICTLRHPTPHLG